MDLYKSNLEIDTGDNFFFIDYHDAELQEQREYDEDELYNIAGHGMHSSMRFKFIFIIPKSEWKRNINIEPFWQTVMYRARPDSYDNEQPQSLTYDRESCERDWDSWHWVQSRYQRWM